MKRYLSFIIIILLFGCDLFKSQEEPEPNNVPSVANAILTPQNPLLADPVDLSYNFSDADSDEDQSEIKWYRNDEAIDNEGTTLPVDGAVDGDKIYVEVTAYDGIDYGNTVKSNTVFYEREKFTPNINYLSNLSGNEDEIDVGSVVKDMQGKITDQDHTLNELVIELTQINPDLIKLKFSDDYNQILIESYQDSGSGENEITIKVTDPDGLVAQKTFKYIINPMTDISGTIIDSDTWEANTTLQGWIIIDEDTTWADEQCKYSTQVEPTTAIDIEAGYRSLDKTQPMSFITTTRDIASSLDVSNADIMVVTYLNNNMTPEEFRILAWETNFSGLDKNYTGAKVPSVDMIEYMVWESYTGDIFTQAEMDDVKKVISDSINVHLNYPPTQVDTSYFFPQTEEERTNVIKWIKHTVSNPAIGSADYNNDGIVDFIYIKSKGNGGFDFGIHYDAFISNLLEEGFSGRGMFGPPTDPILEGKTLVYEHKGTEWVHDADIKFIKFIEGVAHEIGYLKPKMPIDDVFKIQE